MSEQANGTAAASTPAQSAGQAHPSAQSGQSGELETLRSQYSATVAERDLLKQQYEGSRKFYDRAAKLGFKSEDDFGRIEPLMRTVESKKLRIEDIAAAFADNPERDEPGQPDLKAQFDKYAKDMGLVSQAELAKQRRIDEERSRHSEMTKAEREALKELKARVLPEDADDWDKEVYDGFIDNYLNQNRRLQTDKEHPFYYESYNGPEMVLPHDRASLEKLLTDIAGKRDKVRGAQAAAKGDEHNKRKGQAPTVAGAAASTPAKTDRNRPKTEAEEIEDAKAIMGRAVARRGAA